MDVHSLLRGTYMLFGTGITGEHMMFKPGDKVRVFLDIFGPNGVTGTVMDRKNLDPPPAESIEVDNARILVVSLDDWDNSTWVYSPYFLVWASYCELIQEK